MTERSYGRTKSGKLITDAEIERYAAEAEAGYDVDELIARRGKRGAADPRLGPCLRRVGAPRSGAARRTRLSRHR